MTIDIMDTLAAIAQTIIDKGGKTICWLSKTTRKYYITWFARRLRKKCSNASNNLDGIEQYRVHIDYREYQVLDANAGATRLAGAEEHRYAKKLL
ncbi:hypothetical protein [Brenneria tiliae]|uniref:Uncharacterized protein n=1 Tax=Brenneria tiliae TaxID=2914984 RepID=A0ABT0MNK5_9GAMM|nr:hypothetical protein [Brenneria tiliae]MCL2891423.1 hypothetical protein [Brenneria tiliae]